MDRYGHLVTDLDDDLLTAIDGTPPPPTLAILPTSSATHRLTVVS